MRLPCPWSFHLRVAADPDSVAVLVRETAPAHACLVFCPSRKQCQSLALALARALARAPSADGMAARIALLEGAMLVRCPT